MKKVLPLAIALIIAFPSASFAAETITREHIFYSTERGREYDAPKNIEKGGKKYRLKGVKYEVLLEKGSEFRKVTIKNLKEKKAPQEKVFTLKGESVQFLIDEGKTTYKKARKEAKYVYEARNPNGFTPDQTRELETADGEKFTGTLDNVTKSGIYQKGVSIPGTFRAPKGAEFFYFTGTGVLWKINTAAPLWQGYQRDILIYLGLSPNAYRITGGRWTATRAVGNDVVKSAMFSGTCNVCDYICTYTDGGEPDRYIAKAVYGSPYKIKAICEYERYYTTLQKAVMAGAGIVILSGAASVILYILKRKKRDETNE